MSDVFFFECGGALRVLRSFPTRRSSVLAGGRRGGEDLLHRCARRRLRPGERPGCRRGDGEGDPQDGGGDGGTDRKSTRLNSSHGNISYAGFCLENKNIELLGFFGLVTV